MRRCMSGTPPDSLCTQCCSTAGGISLASTGCRTWRPQQSGTCQEGSWSRKIGRCKAGSCFADTGGRWNFRPGRNRIRRSMRRTWYPLSCSGRCRQRTADTQWPRKQLSSCRKCMRSIARQGRWNILPDRMECTRLLRLKTTHLQGTESRQTRRPESRCRRNTRRSLRFDSMSQRGRKRMPYGPAGCSRPIPHCKCRQLRRKTQQAISYCRA